MARTYWGVDSASAVTQELFECVRRNYGIPKFWGRYLKTVPNRADGLTANEINFLHQKGIRILPIYSDFRRSVGYARGQIIARNAIFHAERLKFPKDTVLFANVEHHFEVGEGWIRGWVDTFYPSGYRPGFYHDPVKGGFSAAFCAAVSNSERVKEQAILWSAEPEPGVSNEGDAPAFNPAKPPCPANVWGWQYGRDATDCPIDTNLITDQMYRLLW
jgi:hypothetical protein